jgi:hypothetical protein
VAPAVIHLVNCDAAAVETLGDPGDLTVEAVEMDDGERAILGDAVGSVGCCQDDINGVRCAACDGAAVDA